MAQSSGWATCSRLPSGSSRSATRSPAETRQARKDLARIEGQLAKLDRRVTKLHEQMAAAASDYGKLAELQRELTTATDEQAALEEAWLVSAETLD